MFVRCKVCEGHPNRVTVVLGVPIRCSYCQGEGGFEIPEGKKLCPICKGAKTVYKLDKHKDNHNYKQDCEKCGGLGYIN